MASLSNPLALVKPVKLTTSINETMDLVEVKEGAEQGLWLSQSKLQV